MGAQNRVNGDGYLFTEGTFYPGEIYVEPGTLLVRWRPREGSPVPSFLEGRQEAPEAPHGDDAIGS